MSDDPIRPEGLTPDDDPGWRPGPRGQAADGLVALRFVFLAVVVSLVMVGVVVGLLASTSTGDDDVSTWSAALLVVGVGAAALVIIRAVPPRFDCSSDLALATSWRNRFFLRVALSELPALAGFVAFMLAGVPALYPLGATFTAVGLAASGPMRANLARDQEILARSGCVRPLVPALRRAVPRPKS